MAKKISKPEAYRTTLRSREAITEWLLADGHGWEKRGGHNYENGNWLFCFDVKLHGLHLSFHDLLRLHEKSEGVLDASRAAGCRKRWREEFEGNEQALENLYETAAENVRSDFIGRGDGRPGDCWNYLWDGTPVGVKFAFMGRGGGWLVLTQFQLWNCTPDELGNALDDGDGNSDLPYHILRQLYQYLLMLRHDLRDPCAEVEYQAADYFFNHFCEDVPSSEQSRVSRQTAERARRKFVKSFLVQQQRRIGLTRVASSCSKLSPLFRPRTRRVGLPTAGGGGLLRAADGPPTNQGTET